MKKIIAFSLLAVGLSVSFVASAAEFVSPDKSGQVSISASQNPKNLYTAGGQVTVDSPVTGDLTVAGGNLILNGTVSGGLLAAGGNVSTNGAISGTARIAGGSLNINSPVGGDLVIGGGNISIRESSAVGGDLIAGGGNITINAPVNGNVKIGGGMVYINSRINGTVDVIASNGLTFGPNADVSNVVHYRGPDQAKVDSAAKVANIQFTKLEQRNKKAAAGLITLGTLIQLAALLIIGFLLLHFRRHSFTETAAYIRSHPWASLGIGLLSIIVTPIIAILLFVTFVGYYLGILLLVSFALMLLLNTIFAFLFLGHFVLKLFNRSALTFPNWQIVILGVVLWELIKFIPIIGWIILAIIYLLSFGALVIRLTRSLRPQS